MEEIKQPELRGKDKHGNVRPADDRFLSSRDKKKRDAYVAKVGGAPTADGASPDVEQPTDLDDSDQPQKLHEEEVND